MIIRAHGFKRFWLPLLAASLTLLLNFTAFAQSTGTLQGTVTDSLGAAVVGAKITIRNEATGTVSTTKTNGEGNYQMPGLLPSTYSIDIEAEGFEKQTQTGITLNVSQTVTANAQLKVGLAAQTVTITATPPVIDSTGITVGQVINSKTVQDIPLNGRHFVDLGLLIPGTVTPPQNGFLTAPLRGQGSFAFDTAGNREDTTNFMINGVNLNDMVQNQITFQPSISTVSEFKVDNSTFSAQYGRNSGSIVNIATRSGSNEWHGEAFEFLRNEKLDASNFFLPTARKGPFKRNQFGGSFGGPIKKDKAFFFFSYEGTRQRQGIPLLSGVLSDTERAAVTDPAAQKLLKFIPEPNTTVGGHAGFVGSASAPVNIDQWTGDVAYDISSKDRIHGYYAFQKDLRNEPVLQGNSIPGFGDTRQSHRQIFTLNETHTFGPAVVNDARLGFSRIHITFAPAQALNPTDFGINDGFNGPVALPQITLQDIGLNFGGPAGFPQGRGDTTYVVSDTVSYLRGNHSFSIGGEFRDFQNNNFGNTAGVLNFSSVSNFGKGIAANVATTLGGPASSLATKSFGLFIQDNYKVRPNLTLELGLRWDLNTSPSERFGRFVNFDPLTDTLDQVSQVYGTNSHNFEPRLGFAWDPFNDGKTSVRGAYAILYDQPVTGTVTGATTNPPFGTPVAAQTGGGVTVTLQNPLASAAAAGTVAPAATNANFREPYVQDWNLNIQREITPTLSLMVGYFGSKGTHLRIARNINERILGLNRPFLTLSASSPILPGKGLNNITEVDSSGNSSYNALWVTANKRLKNGMQFNASYTFSKSLDYNSLSSQGVVVQDSFNFRNDRGPSDFDARHRFVINWIYDLPFKGNRLKEGWQLSGITQLQTGNPINLVVVASGAAGFTGNTTIRPDLIGPLSITGDPSKWFTNSVCDPRLGPCAAGAVFAIPVSPSGVFHFGDLGRNAIVGPGFENTDFSVSKSTVITETYRLEFRADF
ncbi:MAG TPA: TonB-dependent receptor, partial [Blastocatellia bacterium]|nr:TonB-dependent receptor [Blastocatellia bacterium]